MTDLHLHTQFSFDSEEKAENYILTAKAQGISRLGFAEHYDYDVFLKDGNPSCLADIPSYLVQCARLSEKYPSVQILRGIELGYCKGAIAHYQALLSQHAFDYAVLSVHTLPERGDCYFPQFYTGLTKTQAYGKYLEAVLDSVRSELNFQIVGHIGYIARYAPYADKRMAYREFSSVIDEILSEIIARGKCLEINTSAKGTSEITVPSGEILERYLALGGTNFSFGSDAHAVNRFMENAHAVEEFLLSHGVTHTCRFESGKLIKEKIEK